MKKTIIIFWTILLFSSCASMPKKSLNLPKISFEKARRKIEGTYLIPKPVAQKNELTDAIGKMMNKPQKGRFDLNENQEYSLGIKIKSDSDMALNLLENGSIISEIEVKYKKSGDYFYLKNHNVQRHNIPFILGGLIILKVRLAVHENGNLIFDCVEEGYGAALFFIWSGEPTRRYSDIFPKIP